MEHPISSPQWLIAVAFAGLLAAFGSAAAEPSPKRGGTLEFAVLRRARQLRLPRQHLLCVSAPGGAALLDPAQIRSRQLPAGRRRSGGILERVARPPTYTFKLRPNVLFHDGSKLTSADVKASYERIIHPPPGVVSARQVDYAAIASIDTPDPRTVVFHLQWPEAAMLANFASPWNCIYSAAKLAEDPQFPKTHMLGTGPFVFVEHAKGQNWRGARWDKYFQPGKPYLDGYQADFMTGAAVMRPTRAAGSWPSSAASRPPQRDELVEALGDRIADQREPVAIDAAGRLQHQAGRRSMIARVRRALSLAIDRWGAAEKLQSTTFFKYVGGLDAAGVKHGDAGSRAGRRIPGFCRDIATSRAEAKRLLAEAGVHDLKLTCHGARHPDAALRRRRSARRELAAKSGSTTTPGPAQHLGVAEGRRQRRVRRRARFLRRFLRRSDNTADEIRLARFVAGQLSPGRTDRFLDALYIGQAMTSDPRQRAKIVRDFERHALTEAYTVPLLWWNRIVATSAQLKGWSITPSHFIGQDLTDVWLDRRAGRSNRHERTRMELRR